MDSTTTTSLQGSNGDVARCPNEKRNLTNKREEGRLQAGAGGPKPAEMFVFSRAFFSQKAFSTVRMEELDPAVVQLQPSEQIFHNCS